ncbi:MAG TPA: acetyl-CoA carboxylase, carboxyltransferase subunit beta [bacterium]|nr:acetyl-CoA carboxylase, carboxyltransferase subunit beta [bacterium]HPP12186.1 acetyl-CoA carboxylase, carboxyltransferase subunit beta [bacterium]
MIFRKRYARITPRETPEAKKELWVKCERCGRIVYEKKWKEMWKVCHYCGSYSRLTALERIELLTDPGTFQERWSNLISADPLEFVGARSYVDKLKEDMLKTGLKEALVTGEAKIGGFPVALAILDPHFIMGSMGSVVGEKFVRICELCLEKKWPLVSVSGGGGGARMYEGALSLMQMAKTSAAVERLHRNGLFYISVLTDPTMGGVAASFAFLGDIILAEPGALIGFAGPRVIEQTIRQKLPPGFQTSEFLYQRGMIDLIVERKDLKQTITRLLNIIH